MVAHLVLAFGTSALLCSLIALTAWWLRQPGPGAAHDPPGGQRPACRLHDWEWTEGFGYVCRRCRRVAG